MRLRVVLVVFLVLSGCSKLEGSGPFALVGKFDDYNETITGEVSIDYDRGVSFITARTRDSKLRCEGLSRVTYTPPYPGRVQELVCFGQQGIARLQCTDGRILTGNWRAGSCNSGEGAGTDNTGARFSFSFGMSQAEAQQYLASAQAEQAQKPRFPGGSSPQMRQPGSVSTGTGFLVSADGLIVTNHHVIDSGGVIEVHDGDAVHRATVIARDAANDLAVLKTDLKGQPLRLASARGSVRGDEVLTLGFPLDDVQGRNQKASFGRINALTGINDDSRFIQIDIPIQPGNSGGPLITKRGEVIGVVSASLNDEKIFRSTGAVPQNVNYAVKADYISALLPSISQTASTTPSPSENLSDVVRASENSVFLIA
jgi:S1-C subfamily serine protease